MDDPTPAPAGMYPTGLPEAFRPVYDLNITTNSFWTIVHDVNRLLREQGFGAAAAEFLQFAQQMEDDLGMLFMLCLAYVRVLEEGP